MSNAFNYVIIPTNLASIVCTFDLLRLLSKFLK